MERTKRSTSDLQRSKEHTISPTPSSSPLRKKRKCEVSSHLEETTSTTKKTLSPNSEESPQSKGPRSHTAASAPNTKETTSRDKSPLSNKDTHVLKSSETSGQELTSRRKVSRKSFRRLCREVLRSSSSLTKIDYAALDMSSSRPYATSMAQRLWCCIRNIQMENESSLTTSLQSVTSSWQERMVKEQQEIDASEKKKSKKTRLGKRKTIRPDQSKRCKKVKVRLTPEQKRIIKRFLGAHRFVFNACVDLERYWDPWGIRGLDAKGF